jgi:Zn ribbon nucleic-acid-binding protein
MSSHERARVRMISPESLRDGLKEIRRRRRLHWTVSLIALAGSALLVAVSADRMFAWSALVVLLGLAVTAQYAFDSTCPRCGQQFASRPGEYHNPLTQRCVHCGLRLRATEAELRDAVQAPESSNPGAA